MKISELFPRKYATGADLNGKPATLTIARVTQEEMRPNPNAKPEAKWVLYFKGAQKGIVLSRTLAQQIAEITGEDDTDHWPGKRVTLYPVPMTVAGQARVAIRARKPTNGTEPPPSSLTDDQDDDDPTAAPVEGDDQRGATQ